MNSFDVFDTLIGRRYLTSKPIFEQISKEFRIDDFVERRIKADNGSRILSEIYQSMNVPQEVMDRELALEHEYVFPIQENMDRVSHGDLLISDMYLPRCYILSLVRHAGLDKQVTIYQSNQGKMSGDVWSRMKNKAPKLHIGDNRVSDFEVPRSFGIPCELFDKSKLTKNENFFISKGLANIGLLMREVRLRGKVSLHPQLSDIAGQLNLPWLFIAAELFHRTYSKRDKVFLGRDSQLLYKLYNAYYEPAFYLPFSRKLAYAQPEASIIYLKSHAPEGALFVDLRSTGGTWEKLQAPVDIAVLIYLDNYKYTKEQPILPHNFSYIIKSSECPSHLILESFNCGDHGYISELDVLDGTLLRGVFSEDKFPTSDIIQSIQEPVKKSLELTRFYKNSILSELRALETSNLLELLKTLTRAICNNQSILQLYPEWYSSETNYHHSVVEISHS